jgi:hypothetical protein
MEDFLQCIGTIGAFFMILIVVVLIYDTEMVHISTFKKGLVIVDKDTTYRCELTEQSKAIKKKKEELEELENKGLNR